MKKRMLAALLALCMVLSMGAGAFASEGEEGYIPFLTESGDDYFHAEEPTTVTMTATVPQDGTYVVITMPMGPSGDEENFSLSSDNAALAFLAEQEPHDLLNGGYWSVELTAGDYAVTAENVRSLGVHLVYVDTSILPASIPEAAERVTAHFRYAREDGTKTSTFRADEPSSCEMTANVEQEGPYLVTVDAQGSETLSLAADGDALAFLDQLEAEDPSGLGMYEIEKTALVELTAGEYTLHVENAGECSVRMELAHPLDAVDGVIGEGLYVCQLDEAATVNYTVIGLGSVVAFYTGAEQALSKAEEVRLIDENSKQQPVTFAPGAAVIDFEGGHVTSALVGDGAESPAEGASESAVPEAVLNHYGLSAEEFAALKAAIAAQIQEEWTADEPYDSNLMGLYDWTYMTDFIIRIHSDETSDSILGENIGKNLMTDESMDRCIEELAQYCTGDDALFQQRAMVLGHGINRWAADNGVSYERWRMVWEGVMTALSTYVSGSILTDGNPTDEYIRPLFSQEN